MERFTLYIANRAYSSWSLRAWLACKHVGLEAEEIVIPLDQPDTRERIRACSPSGRLPALRYGDLTVWDSLAICEYLAENFPQAALWPAAPAARAVARSVCAEMHSGFVPLRAGMPMNLKRHVSAIEMTPEMRADIQRIITVWEDCRRRFGSGGDFLFGRFSIADASFAPMVARFHTYSVPLEGGAADYAAAVWALPAMRAWIIAAKAEPWRIKHYDDPSA